MKEEKEFYIGWQDDMPKSNAAFLKKLLIPLFILIPILVFAIVYFQKPFNNFKFEFGNITTITGTYYESPIPMVIADKGSLADSLSHDVVLVGYGKFGASGIISDIEQENGSLDGKKIELAGTLIYGDGKTMMELTEKKASLKQVFEGPSTQATPSLAKNAVTVEGEIIDPKCYFGAMKPGEGKIHKSCAIRCISGGTPPILKTKNNEFSRYYILLDEQGRTINKQVLPFVAEQISVSGSTNQFSNWDVLYIDVDDLHIKS